MSASASDGTFLLVVTGALPRKNRRDRTRVVTGRERSWVQHYPSAQWKDWISRLTDVVYRSKIVDPVDGTMLRGALEVSVLAEIPKKRYLDDVTVALGDVDSPTSAVLDGLKKLDALDDDVRVVKESSMKVIGSVERITICIGPYGRVPQPEELASGVVPFMLPVKKSRKNTRVVRKSRSR